MATQKAAQPQDHSHASNQMSSSSSWELITQPGIWDVSATHTHPDRATGMRSSSSLKKKKSPFKQPKCLASCCQESCHHGKEKENVPKISVESLPRTVNIFGSPQRTNAFLSLAGSAVLKRHRLQADWWWPVGAMFSGWHLRQAASSLEWEYNAPVYRLMRTHAEIFQKPPSRIHNTALCLCLSSELFWFYADLLNKTELHNVPPPNLFFGCLRGCTHRTGRYIDQSPRALKIELKKSFFRGLL